MLTQSKVDRMVVLGDLLLPLPSLEGAAQASNYGELDLDGATLGTTGNDIDAASLTSGLLLGARFNG